MPGAPVLESDEEPVARLRLNLNYVPIHKRPRHHGNGLYLRRRCVFTAEPPIFLQFLSIFIIVHSLTRFRAPLGSSPWTRPRCVLDTAGPMPQRFGSFPQISHNNLN